MTQDEKQKALNLEVGQGMFQKFKDDHIGIPNISDAVYYTQAEADAYNAELTGALNSTTPLTAEQAAAYNAAVTGATKEAGDTLSSAEAAAYNATLEGAVSTSDIKTPAVPTKVKKYVDDGLSCKADKLPMTGAGAATENNFMAIDANGNIKDSGKKASDFLTQHQSVVDSNPTLAWGQQSKVGSVGSTDLHVTLPANPATGKEDTSNKVTSLSSSSTDTQYPSAKCVRDNILANSTPIPFESEVTKALMVNAFGGKTGGSTGIPGVDGEITYAQAANANFTSNMFNGIEANTPFTELRFFKADSFIGSRPPTNIFYNSKFTELVFPEGVTNIRQGAVDTGISDLYVELPSTVTFIERYNFINGRQVILKIHAATPPTFEQTIANGGLAHVYVPNDSVNAYKAAAGWSNIASIIEGF